jgi:hypothetical protein
MDLEVMRGTTAVKVQIDLVEMRNRRSRRGGGQ